jgi:hypothetical protein
MSPIGEHDATQADAPANQARHQQEMLEGLFEKGAKP